MKIWHYIKAAFNAKPIGMFLPPNWLGLGLIFLLGLMEPGLWLLGLGLELTYLYALSGRPVSAGLWTGRTFINSEAPGKAASGSWCCNCCPRTNCGTGTWSGAARASSPSRTSPTTPSE